MQPIEKYWIGYYIARNDYKTAIITATITEMINEIIFAFITAPSNDFQ